MTGSRAIRLALILVIIACLGVGFLLVPRMLARSGPLVGWPVPSALNIVGLVILSVEVAMSVVLYLGRVKSVQGRRHGTSLLWIVPLGAIFGAIVFTFLLLGVVFIPYITL